MEAGSLQNNKENRYGHFGDATRQAKKKQDEDEKQKSAADAADANAADDTAAADANAAVDTAAADASAAVDDDNGEEATTPAAPTTTQDPNSGLVSCPTPILTLISALLTLAIRTWVKHHLACLSINYE